MTKQAPQQLAMMESSDMVGPSQKSGRWLQATLMCVNLWSERERGECLCTVVCISERSVVPPDPVFDRGRGAKSVGSKDLAMLSMISKWELDDPTDRPVDVNTFFHNTTGSLENECDNRGLGNLNHRP